MRIRGWTGLGVFGAILAATACSSTDAEPGCLGSAGSSAAGAGNDGSAGRGTGQDAGTGGDVDIPSGNGEAGASGAGSGPSAALPARPDGFSPSNLEPDLDLSVDADFVLNGETCGDEAHLNTDTGQIDCSQSGAQVAYQFQIAKQGDGSEVGVFAGRNITVAPNVLVVVEGQRPLVLLTPGDVQINGTIEAIANRISSYEGNAGGFSGPAGEQVKGKGPGGGSGTSTEAGGGAFCGKGGSGALGGRGGAGGGAVQIIAGGKLTLAATGVIHVGGAGGGWNGGGGGSGGAILLEANVITIAGTLAANGGGGGEGDGVAGDSGLNASPDAVPAPSGNGTATSDDNGGDGSAAKLVDGSPGGIVSGGGGGGAGRIRLNSKSGMALVSGVLSPSADSDCVTQGVLGS
jgi:hypothetical protein